MATKKTAKKAPKKTAEEKQQTADEKLAATPSPAIERVTEQGDWAASNNPSPEEQQAESERQDAIRRLENI